MFFIFSTSTHIIITSIKYKYYSNNNNEKKGEGLHGFIFDYKFNQL